MSRSSWISAWRGRLGENHDPELTKSGLFLGTPHYMPPERARGQYATGPASDIYSLGVILYELLTGQRRWQDQPT